MAAKLISSQPNPNKKIVHSLLQLSQEKSIVNLLLQVRVNNQWFLSTVTLGQPKKKTILTSLAILTLHPIPVDERMKLAANQNDATIPTKMEGTTNGDTDRIPTTLVIQVPLIIEAKIGKDVKKKNEDLTMENQVVTSQSTHDLDLDRAAELVVCGINYCRLIYSN